MYYLKRMEDKVRVAPKFFSQNINDVVTNLLRERYERRIFQACGLVIHIGNIKISGDGIIVPGDVGAHYNVEFDAVTFVPKINEVFVGEIKDLLEFGAFMNIGPLDGLVHISQLSSDRFYYDKKSKCLVGKTTKNVLKKGDVVTGKISTVSMKGTTSSTKIGITMRADGLGKEDWKELKKKREKKGREEKEKGDEKEEKK